MLNASGQDVLTTVFSIRARSLSASTVYQRSLGRLNKETRAHSPLLRKLRLFTCHFYWPLSPFRRDICRAPVTYRKMVQIPTAMVLVLEEWLKGGRGWRRTVWHTAWHPIGAKRNEVPWKFREERKSHLGMVSSWKTSQKTRWTQKRWGGGGRAWVVLARRAKTHTLQSDQWERRALLARKPLVMLWQKGFCHMAKDRNQRVCRTSQL